MVAVSTRGARGVHVVSQDDQIVASPSYGDGTRWTCQQCWFVLGSNAEGGSAVTVKTTASASRRGAPSKAFL